MEVTALVYIPENTFTGYLWGVDLNMTLPPRGTHFLSLAAAVFVNGCHMSLLYIVYQVTPPCVVSQVHCTLEDRRWVS